MNKSYPFYLKIKGDKVKMGYKTVRPNSNKNRISEPKKVLTQKELYL